MRSSRAIWPSVARVRLEAGSQCRRGRLVDHLGQRLGDLVLRVIYVLQLVEEQVVERDDVVAEKTHELCLSLKCQIHVWTRVRSTPTVYPRLRQPAPEAQAGSCAEHLRSPKHMLTVGGITDGHQGLR